METGIFPGTTIYQPWHASRYGSVMNLKPCPLVKGAVPAVVAILMAAAVSSHAAGRNHFREWAAGDVLSLDDGAHHISLQPGRTFKWDKSTQLYVGTGKKPLPATRIIGSVHKGDHVRLLYEKHGKETLAKRIIVEHEAAGVGQK